MHQTRDSLIENSVLKGAKKKHHQSEEVYRMFPPHLVPQMLNTYQFQFFKFIKFNSKFD